MTTRVPDLREAGRTGLAGRVVAIRCGSADRHRSPFSLPKWRVGILIATTIGALLAGCVSENQPTADAGVQPDFFSSFAGKDLGARRNGDPEPFGNAASSARSGSRIYRGDDGAAPESAVPAAAGLVPTGDGYQLNFENADVAAICRIVFGDVLQQTYTVDPRVMGQVNLSSARPVPKASLIRILETAFKAVNVVIIREGATLRVAPSAEGIGAGPTEFGTASDGYGTTVISPRHMSVATVARIMENFAVRPGAIKADIASNLILIQGTAQERHAAMDAANVVDTDVMRSQSVGVFPLLNAPPEPVIAELNKLLDAGEGGVSQNLVKFQPMTRMNAVLVVARRADVLAQVKQWVRRLDHSDPGAVGVKVYRLKYAKAKTVAAMLNDILSGRQAGAGQQDRDALQPSSSNASGTFVQSSAGAPRPGGPNGSAFGNAPGGSPMGGPPKASGFGDGSSGNTGSPDSQADANSGPAQGSLSKVRVTADVINNSLLIIASPADYKIVEAALLQLDRPPVQVAIEATIAEVTLTDQLQFGVQSFLHSNDVGLTAKDQGTLGLTSAVATAAIRAAVPGGNLILGPASSPRIILSALHAMTAVKVLSSPSMVVLDNQPAVLQVGNQVAIKTQSSQSTENVLAPVINSIMYKDTGIILRVQPHVHANGIVNLEVEQEISNVVDNSGGVDGLTPTISQRRVKSSIVVSSGQTVLLAGMISEQSGHAHNGLPGLTTWKWLDSLVGHTNKNASRSELIIFIKPKIMRDQADAQAVSEEFRARMTAMLPGVSPRTLGGPRK